MALQIKIAHFLRDVMNEDATLKEFNWRDIGVDDIEYEDKSVMFRVNIDGELFDIIVKEI